jgi:hypothetical protein
MWNFLVIPRAAKFENLNSQNLSGLTFLALRLQNLFFIISVSIKVSVFATKW